MRLPNFSWTFFRKRRKKGICHFFEWYSQHFPYGIEKLITSQPLNKHHVSLAIELAIEFAVERTLHMIHNLIECRNLVSLELGIDMQGNGALVE